jgi:hypothetical protein
LLLEVSAASGFIFQQDAGVFFAGSVAQRFAVGRFDAFHNCADFGNQSTRIFPSLTLGEKGLKHFKRMEECVLHDINNVAARLCAFK